MQGCQRMQAVQDPVIPMVGDLVRSHPGTISLGQGVVHYPPPKEAADALCEFWDHPENHKYHAVEGIPALRAALQEKLHLENHIQVDEADDNPDASRLCVTAGGNMAFFEAVLAITDPGDEVIILSPFYFNHEMAVRIAGCRPVIVPTDAKYQPDPESIRLAITPKTRAVLTVSPNNPTGAVYPKTTLQEINRICGEQGIYHIHDEAYEYFVYGETPHVSPGSFINTSGHTLSLFSLSKAYGFAGWRMGYMVYPHHLHMSIKKIQDTNLICPPIVSQVAALGALKAGASYCRGWLSEYAEVRSLFVREMQALGDRCEIPMADGAFYFFLQIHSDWDEMQLIERLVKEYGVAAMPGKSFGMTHGCSLRVAYGALRKETAVEGIGRLIEGLTKLAG